MKMPASSRAACAVASALAICHAAFADVAQPARTPAAQPAARTYAQPAAAQPAARTYAQPAARTYAQPAARTYAQPAAQPAAARTYAQPTANATAQPAAARTYAQPTANAAAQPAAARTTVQPAAWRTVQPRPLQPQDDVFGHWLEKSDDKGWIAGRLEIGWRVVRPEADTKHRWHDGEGYGFLGTMEYLDEADDYDFLNFVVSYKLTDWFALGATWDRISEVATTRSSDNHQDGEWKESGPSLSAVLTTPRLFDFFSPYAEVGVHFPSGTFDAYPWWANGYPSPAYYASIGSPATLNGSYQRVITAQESDSMTLLWGVGLKFYLADHFAIDLAYRHIDCDIDAEYRLYAGGRMISDHGAYKIPLSYSQLCLGVRWAF